MQRPSFPKETADQWPPIAGDHTGWGGAGHQSINTGRSLGERDNLMRHTPTHLPPDLISSPSSGPSPSSRSLFSSFLTLFISAKPQLQPNSPAPLRCATFLPPSSTPPPPMTSLKFQGDRTHKREECCHAGAGNGGEIDGFW